MDKDCFNGAGIPLMEFQTAAAMAGQWNGPNCPSDLGLLNPSNSSLDHFQNFEPSFNSMVSSSLATNEAFFLRELIGKLGSTAGGNVADESNFRASLTQAKVQFPIVADQINPNLGNQVSLPPPPPPVAAIPADPGFIERAAKFSCFGSRSFNGRTSPIGNGSPTPHPLTKDSKLPRVSSSPALKPNGSSPLQNRNATQTLVETKPGTISGGPDKKSGKLAGSGTNSNEESSVSEQTFSNNSRKRKGPSVSASRGKSKEEGTITTIPVKGEDEGNGKRSKAAAAAGGGETCSYNNEENEKQEKADNKKAAEPPKDYIHVRARRGQATDSHSLAERVRREKISERMKLLQDLVPGCNKVTGKALMLDEIINYVQSLQRQVEFLSMKLASVNPRLDFNMETLLSKDMFQHSSTGLPQQMYSGPEVQLYHQNVQPQLHDTTRAPPDPIHFSPLDGFTENFLQLNEDDLHSIVQMGFVQNPANFPVENMKIER